MVFGTSENSFGLCPGDTSGFASGPASCHTSGVLIGRSLAIALGLAISTAMPSAVLAQGSPCLAKVVIRRRKAAILHRLAIHKHRCRVRLLTLILLLPAPLLTMLLPERRANLVIRSCRLISLMPKCASQNCAIFFRKPSSRCSQHLSIKRVVVRHG